MVSSTYNNKHSVSLKAGNFSPDWTATNFQWIKCPIFWDITPCRPLKVNRRFGWSCCLHLQGRRISQARDQHEADSKLCLEEACSSETSVDFLWTTRRYTP
jgi:hypothetical protein